MAAGHSENRRKSDQSAQQPRRLGLRERNKIEKEKLIREAARKLFLKNGYEATTLREIAEEADVGFGTVSSYSSDKSGLLAMIYVEELKKLPPLFATMPERGELLDQLVDGLGKLYAFWGHTPSLSRHVLQQLEFYSTNPHVDAILARRSQAKGELADWLKRKKLAGLIAPQIDVDNAVDTLFAIYTSAVREWTVTAPSDLHQGTTRLRALMEIAVRGLQASAFLKPSRRGARPPREPRRVL